MLPAARQNDHQYAVPKFDLERKDVQGFIHELEGFHEQFAGCFRRSESRMNFLRYMAGQFSELKRKSIEPIALSVEGGEVRAMQHFVSEVEWDDRQIAAKYRSMVNEDMGSPDGALLFDETGFAKKGEDSIGVSKQYCGTLGKVENSQVGVFAGYVSPDGYALVDKRLYIPEKWFEDSHEKRREKCELPPETHFKSKPQLAAEMLKAIATEGSLPFKYVLGDSIYGESPDFIKAVEDLVGVHYFVSISSKTPCWLQAPMVVKKEYQYKGRLKIKKALQDPAKKPLPVKQIAENIHDNFWYRRKVSEGTKGPIEYEFTKRRVVLSKSGLPNRTVWLVVRRTTGRNPEYSYYISNAPVSTRLKTFVWLSGLRWAIEQCFEETKTEVGMDQYEVRKFRGWHHHILACMLAHFFLWHLKIRLGKKSTVYYSLAA